MKKFLIFIFLGNFAFLSFSQTGVVAKRLDKITQSIPLTYNAYVEEAINTLLLNDQNKTSEILGKSGLYVRELEDSLRVHHLPVELKYLPASLSSYNNWLVSDDGGSGYWQLRYLTAKRYAINISSYVDERRDFKMATQVAINYLSDLHKIYQDWLLTIAAFYGDETEVNKAIRLAGGSKNYWDIHRFLPARFQATVPNYIASVYIHSYYQLHNLTPVKYNPPGLEKVPILQWTTIYQLSKALEIDFDTLKDLNAIYKKQVIPHTQKTYYLLLPFDKVGRFYQLGDSVYSYGEITEKDTVEEPEEAPVVQRPEVQEPELSASNKHTASSTKLLYYTVKKGDYLGKIADLYDVNISDIRRWNEIKGDKINVNQRLKIYVPAAKYDQYSGINAMSSYQKQQIINKD
ncbi:MAG: LysM peptidoglycan-binding domain-containing protein [Bacteroidetes bacterium]|nr:LysM peptidoglycan-binding domain-containing protein [Bacteroidota bacterium]